MVLWNITAEISYILSELLYRNTQKSSAILELTDDI